MPDSLNEALEKLEKLRPEKLDQVSRRIRRKLGEAEWEMCICLLAWQRQGSFRKLRYSTITEYAEKALHMSGQKVGWLLNAARALEHLPLMSQAFRTGLLCWGKLRALQSVVTPETEQQWLDYALAHRTDEVVKKVSASPREWKRHQALQASLEGQPTATQERVTRILRVPEQGISPRGNSRGDFSGPPLCPTTPRTIRLTVELTPDQFALYEAAASRVRAQEGKYVSRSAVVTKMAEAVLNQGSSRARARHQVVVHTNPDSGEAWYETSKGELPAASEVVEEALKPSGHEVVHLEAELVPTEGRKLTNATIRAVHAQAGHCCERCGKRGGSLDIHHKKPVSEGGDNSLENLQLLCPACHTMEHESDFECKPHWREARASRLKPPQGQPKWPSTSCEVHPTFRPERALFSKPVPRSQQGRLSIVAGFEVGAPRADTEVTLSAPLPQSN